MPVQFDNCLRVVAASPKITNASPYPQEVPWVAIVWGGTIDNVPPVEWAQSLSTSIGLTAEAQATVCLRYVPSFLWTAFYDPTGQATPAQMLPSE